MLQDILTLTRWTNDQTKALIKIKKAQRQSAAADKILELYKVAAEKDITASSNPKTSLLRATLLKAHKNSLSKDPIVKKFDDIQDALINKYQYWIAQKEFSKPIAKCLYAALIDRISNYKSIDTKAPYHDLLKPMLGSIKARAETTKDTALKLALTLSPAKTIQMDPKTIELLTQKTLEATKVAKVFQIENTITIEDIVSMAAGLTTDDTCAVINHPVISNFRVSALYAVIISEAKSANYTKLKALIEMLPEGGIAFMADNIPDEQLTKLLDNLHENESIPDQKKKHTLVIKPLLDLISPKDLVKLSPVWGASENRKRPADSHQEEEFRDTKAHKTHHKTAQSEPEDESSSSSSEMDYRCDSPISHLFTEAALEAFTPVKASRIIHQEVSTELLGAYPLSIDLVD